MRAITFALCAAAALGAATVVDAGGIDHRHAPYEGDLSYRGDVPYGDCGHRARPSARGAEAIADLLAPQAGPSHAFRTVSRARHDPTRLGLGLDHRHGRAELAHHGGYRAKRPRGHRWVPAHCVRHVGHHGHRPVVGARCVRRSLPDMHLPRHCLSEVWHRGHYRWAYGLHCLRRDGYHVH